MSRSREYKQAAIASSHNRCYRKMEATVPVCLLVVLASLSNPCASCGPEEITPPPNASCKNISTQSPYCGHLYEQSYYSSDIGVVTGNIDGYLRSGTNRSLQTCSRYFELHVCLSVLPVCRGTSDATLQLRLPCQDLCRQVSVDCSGELADPICLFNCDKFPETDCVGLQDEIVTENVLPLSPTPTPTAIPSVSPSGTPSPLVNETQTHCPSESQTYFSDEAKRFAKGWVTFWSILCFLSTLVTLLTFCLDTSRFQYPWRPVVYLALSFHIHTWGYFFAFIVGSDNVTCPDGTFVETEGKWTWLHTPCILVYGLLYYTMMSAFLWWLILTLSWFLSSTYKWTNEAISQFSLFYHTAAWMLPLILTITLLVARVVSADELTGTCFILRTKTRSSFLALLLGIILPLSVILLLGSLFIIIGFVGLLQIRRFMVHRGKERESVILEKLMIRIGVYVAMYIIPAAVLIACFIYEIDTRPHWHTLSDPCEDCSRPNTGAFMVRIFMFLLIGILTGAWIWSRKTLQSWKKLPVKLRNCMFPGAERTQDNPTCVAEAKLTNFTTNPHPIAAPSPSYPYTIESEAEFSS